MKGPFFQYVKKLFDQRTLLTFNDQVKVKASEDGRIDTGDRSALD